MTDIDEFLKYQDKLVAGEDVNGYKFSGEITQMPKQFNEWVKANEKRIKSAKSLPYFIRDNYVGGDISKGLVFASKPFTILERAAIRHAQRTQEQINEIKRRNSERLNTYRLIDKTANNILKVANEYAEVDVTTFKTLIAKRDMFAIKAETRKVAKQIAEVRKDEKMLSNLIPDVHEWKKQFTSAELHEVYDAVEKKIADIKGKALKTHKYSTHLKQELADFEFEIKYVADPTKYKPGAIQYPTWKVSQAAYAKQHAQVLDAIDWENIDNVLQEALTFKTKSKPYLDLVDTLQEAISKNDKSLAQKTILDIKAKRAELDKAAMARQRKKMGNIKPTNLPDMSKDEIDRLLDLFNNETMDDADKRLRSLAEQAWATLTDEEKLILTKYTQTYCYLNEPLRGLPYYGSLIPNADHIHDLPILTSALEKFKMPQNTVVRRGVNNHAIPELGYDLSSLKVGDVFTDKGFLSSAVHRNKGFHQDYNLVICVPKGAKGFYAEPFSHYTDYCRFDYKTNTLWDGKSVETIGGEAEWIGQRGSQFKALKKSGKTIYLQMIGQLQ